MISLEAHSVARALQGGIVEVGRDGATALRVSMHHRDPRVAAGQRCAVHALHGLVRLSSLRHNQQRCRLPGCLS